MDEIENGVPACNPATSLIQPCGWQSRLAFQVVLEGLPRVKSLESGAKILVKRALIESGLNREAKAVVLSWSPAEHSIKATSLHSWEKEEALKGGRTTFPVAPFPSSDPQAGLSVAYSPVSPDLHTVHTILPAVWQHLS